MGFRIRFDWLGTAVEVASDAPAFIDFLRGLLSALERPEIEPTVRFEALLRGDTPSVAGNGGITPLSRSNPGLHAWSAILGTLAGGIGERWLLHGAALSREGRGLFLAAPSGFGKTTLALTLVDRGFALLADDIAPLHRDRRVLEPFPRSLSLRSGTRGLLSDRLLKRALDSRRWATLDDGEWLVDPVALFGESTAVPPDVIVLLGSASHRYQAAEVVFAPGLEPAIEELREDPEIAATEPSKGKTGLVLVRARSAGDLERWLERERTRIALATKLPAATPSFEGLPRAQRVTIFESAIGIAQELHNRGDSSRLGREFAGRESELVTDLAGTLGGCRCWSVSVGALEATADRIVDLFDGKDDHDP